MKLIDVVWFGSIGIVVIETETGERKAYIKNTTGGDVNDDVKAIAEFGLPVYPEMLYGLLTRLKFRPAKRGKF